MTTEDFGVQRFDVLGRIAGWGPKLADDARLWLDNFDDQDRPTAATLLNGFVFIDVRTVDAMSCAALASLAPVVCTASGYAEAANQWRDFLHTVLISIPTGEIPNSTDSGYAFQRRARQLMQIPEQHIVEPRDAIIQLRKKGGHIVFVDDIVGSGDQFVKTWHRKYDIGGQRVCLDDISSGIEAYFVPLFATHLGSNNIRSLVPSVNLLPVHQLRTNHSALDPESDIWNDDQHNRGIDLVNRYSQRLGIQQPWGYRDLGLCLAFAHSVPDATLPLFYCEHDDWRPLVRQR